MEKDTLESSDLERQVGRGSLFTHTALSRHSARINEIESFLFAIIDVLTNKGITPSDDLKKAVEEVRKEMMDKGELSNPGLSIRVDDNLNTEFIPVNCNERMHICKAVCCQLTFALSVEEIEVGKVRWDLGNPYMIRQEKNCYCTHINKENKRCDIYEHRPSVCKKYSCAADGRIWTNFEKMELNSEWINANIKESKPHFIRAPMFTDQQTANTYLPHQLNNDEKNT
jgi:Fe-S-cluster containining protein